MMYTQPVCMHTGAQALRLRSQFHSGCYVQYRSLTPVADVAKRNVKRRNALLIHREFSVFLKMCKKL